MKKQDRVITGFFAVVIFGILGFVTLRDSCANPDYARFMGPETCPVKAAK